MKFTPLVLVVFAAMTALAGCATAPSPVIPFVVDVTPSTARIAVDHPSAAQLSSRTQPLFPGSRKEERWEVRAREPITITVEAEGYEAESRTLVIEPYQRVRLDLDMTQTGILAQAQRQHAAGEAIKAADAAEKEALINNYPRITPAVRHAYSQGEICVGMPLGLARHLVEKVRGWPRDYESNGAFGKVSILSWDGFSMTFHDDLLVEWSRTQ